MMISSIFYIFIIDISPVMIVNLMLRPWLGDILIISFLYGNLSLCKQDRNKEICNNLMIKLKTFCFGLLTFVMSLVIQGREVSGV